MMTSSLQTGIAAPRVDAGGFRLDMLELLPCGCVVAVQRMPSTGVRMISMEAKGPHCLFTEHRANRVVRLDSPAEAVGAEDYEDEEATPAA